MQPLVAGCRVNPPYVSECFYKTECEDRGIEIEFISNLMQLMGQPISFQLVSENATAEDVLQLLSEERLNISAESRAVLYYLDWNLPYFTTQNLIDTLIFITRARRIDANNSRYLLFEPTVIPQINSCL